MKLKLIIIGSLIIFTLLIGIYIITHPPVAEKMGTVMGTTAMIKGEGWGSEKNVEEAFERIATIESHLSKNIDNSDVSRINNGDIYWGNRETVRVINRGIFFGDLSDGVFDISIGSIVELYAKNPAPSASEIESAKKLVNYKKIKVEEKLPDGMKIDLGGIAKGYACDEVVSLLKKRGITNILVDIGGDIAVSGGKQWKVGLQNPFKESGNSMGTLTISNKSFATSGTYERGEHIFDTKTGKPIQNEIASASVICDSCMDADALATILFINGKDAFAMIQSQNADAILIMNDGTVYTTYDVENGPFKITDDMFKFGG